MKYNGTGQATLAALAAGPDGLYFSDLYRDDGVGGATAVVPISTHPLRQFSTANGQRWSWQRPGQSELESPNALATKYNIYRNTGTGSFAQIATGILGTSFTDNAVTNGTTYTYMVRGVNLGGESQDSAPVTAKPQVGTGNPPTVAHTAAAVANAGQPNRRVDLSALGADVDEAESNLHYTWAATSLPAGAPLRLFCRRTAKTPPRTSRPI